MQLGLLQQKWVDALRANPEQQTEGILGIRTPEGNKYCCLGKAAEICGIYEWREGNLLSESTMATLGETTIKMLGLRDGIGSFEKTTTINNSGYTSLAGMNDEHLTWLQIADYIEFNPENVFIESL